jgi:Cu2+-containing amine oxidase
MSVINYDYVVDYIFHQNGVIEAKVSLTGYLSASFYYAEEDPYGTHIQPHIQASGVFLLCSKMQTEFSYVRLPPSFDE